MMEYLSGVLPEIKWEWGDDLCDCTFQRIGWWTNAHLGRTMEFRICCAWAKLIELHPELEAFSREIPAHEDPNSHEYETEPLDWNGEFDMPRALWYRQLASKTGKPLAQIRAEYDHLEAPKAVKRFQETFDVPKGLLSFLLTEAERQELDLTITNVQTST